MYCIYENVKKLVFLDWTLRYHLICPVDNPDDPRLPLTGRFDERGQRSLASGKRRAGQSTVDVGRDSEHSESVVRADGERKMA